VLHALHVASLVLRSILPRLHSLAVLEIVLPETLILSSVDMNVHSITVGLVVLPLALVDVPISMPELSSTIGFVLTPLSFVLGVVRPDLDTRAVSHVIQQVALVNGPILESKLFDELKSLLSGILLKLDKIRIFGSKKLRETSTVSFIFKNCAFVLFIAQSRISVVVDLSLSLVI
jgi:hypothetical protein